MKSIQKLSVVFLLTAATMPLQATVQSSADADVVRELKRIGQAVEALEKTMRISVERSRVSLLLQRAELEVAGITSLESQVRNARSVRDDRIAQDERSTAALDDLERRAFEEDEEETKVQLRQRSKQMGLQMQMLRVQARAAEQTLFELEDELAQRSGVFNSLKAEIDELLGIE